MSPPGAWWRLLTLPILAALAAGIGVYASGGPVWRSVVVALTAGVVTWLLVRALTVEADPWPPEPETEYEHGRVPQLWEIVGFDAALERPEYLGRRAIRSVRDVAVPVLRRRGIDLDAPADANVARELLGNRSFELLTNNDHGTPTRADLVALVDRVTQLATATGDGLRPIRIDPRLHPRRGRRSWRSLIGARSSGRSALRATSRSTAESGASTDTSTDGGAATVGAAIAHPRSGSASGSPTHHSQHSPSHSPEERP